MKIRAILSEETLPVRQLILRPGKSLGACIFEGDDQSSSIHLGAFEKENLLGVVSLMKQKSIISRTKVNFNYGAWSIARKSRGNSLVQCPGDRSGFL